MPSPLTVGQHRLLWLIVAAFTLLAVHSSLLTPLWEIPDENDHLDVVVHWAREGTMPDLTNFPRPFMNEGVQPPLAYWGFALGLHALGLDDVKLLSRRRFEPDAMVEGAQAFLHGADEVFPFAGPARSLHLLRLLSVLPGIATVLLACALGRRLVPTRPSAGLLAAALVAFNPSFIALCGGIANDPLAVALSTAGLVLLADLAVDPAPTVRRCLCVGLVIGLAHVAKLSATFLLPLVPLALLLRRPTGERWTASLRRLDAIIAGFLIPAGPYFAWNLVTYGDPFAWGFLVRKYDTQWQISMTTAILERFVPVVAKTYVGQLASSVRAGPPVLIAWGLVVGGGVLGLIAARRRRLPVAWGVVLLLAAGCLVNVTSALKFFLDFNQPQGRFLLPSSAALAALLALGWVQLLPSRLLVGIAAALAALAIHAQVDVLGPFSRLPSRVNDKHFMVFDPLAAVPPERRLDVLPILAPADQSVHVRPPTLSWDTRTDPGAQYTVHLTTPGLAISVQTYEHSGLALRDRYEIPGAFWYTLPPGVSLLCQVIRLPTLDEALHPPAGGLLIEQSAPLVLRRDDAP